MPFIDGNVLIGQKDRYLFDEDITDGKSVSNNFLKLDSLI
jgi:hypothetical protein